MSVAEWYDHGGYPSNGAAGSASAMRAELQSIEDGISAKLPDLAGNGLKIVGINSGATGLVAVATTGTGSVVLATTPTLVTPVLGVATATSINKVAITAPAANATLTIANGKTLTASNTLTLTAVDGSTLVIGTGGTLGTAAYTASSTYAVAGAVGSSTITMNTARLLGRTTASAGAIEEITVGSGLTLSAGALTASSALTLLSTVTASNSATVDIETTWSSTYDAYLIVASGVVPATDGVNLRALMKIGGSYLGTSTYYSHSANGTSSAATYAADTNSAAAFFKVIAAANNTSGGHCDFTMHVHNPSSTSLVKTCYWSGASFETGATRVTMEFGAGMNTGTGALTGVRFQASSGNITSGTFRLYGISNS